VILLDAVNQLAEARDRELWWWPCQWPEEVRVVFSSLPGDVWREMERRGWMGEEKLITVPPLRKEERKEIMERYLKRFSRELDPKLQKKILAAPRCKNPLFLRTMLDELRLRSRHEELGKNIDRMLECEDEAALFVLVLKNLARDFSPEEHPHLVHEGLGLMGMARRGLTERELLELLSPAEEPVSDPIPQHYWAPLYLALEDALVSREGQLSFFHDYLRQAVWREYLNDKHERQTAHRRLAEPAVRWQEKAYGATVRGYGFEHGIGHLLEMERHGEAAAMLLDRGYQNACLRSHRKPRLVARDLQEVRTARAKAGEGNARQAAELSLEVIGAEGRLSQELREALDEASREGEWEEVMEIASAQESDEAGLLLAARGLARADESGGEETEKLVSLMLKWAERLGKPEWKEMVERMTATDSNDAPSKPQATVNQ
jgi:hypothetical protein